MMYYKNQACYSRPMDGVAEVSDADYAELLAKQAQGWQIIDGEDGRPQAVPPQPRRGVCQNRRQMVSLR